MPPTDPDPAVVDVLVIGGGVAGLTTALEAADAGCSVLLVERSPFLGGRVARMHEYFPKLCPPSCGLEINFRRLREQRGVAVRTQTLVEELNGGPGRYEAVLATEPRCVTEACTACGDCVERCPSDGPSDFDYGMSRSKALVLPRGVAFPQRAAIDRSRCPSGCDACRAACRYGAIDLEQRPRSERVFAAAVVAATGWRPYDAARLDTLGFGRFPDVITNVMMERLAAPDGPTGGRILRPSDGSVPRTVAFAQCAGSRDENHLPYCSAVCCAASLKQAAYVRACCPEAAIKIFYMDIRTPGRLEALYARMAEDKAITFVRGKVAQVDHDAATGQVIVTAEDVEQAKKTRERADLLVLATGLVPETAGLPPGFRTDEFGFIAQPPGSAGMHAAGCARQPADVAATVRDATGAALRALQAVARSAHHG